MGVGLSTASAVVPVLPEFIELSAVDVAAKVRSLGAAYEPYAQRVEGDGLDGAFLRSIPAEDLPSILEDIGVTSIIHQKKLAITFGAFKESTAEAEAAAAAAAAAAEPDLPPTAAAAAAAAASAASPPELKRFAAFLSHYKVEAGTEARLVQQNLRSIIDKAPVEGAASRIFIDSDDLGDLRNLLQHVKDTQCLVLLQSKLVLTRPWVIAELYTAVKNDVPLVALNVKNASPYDYASASQFLYRFDEEIEIANPGAADLLMELDVDPVDVAYMLSNSLPHIISTEFNPNGSERQIQASMEDLVDSIRNAVPTRIKISKEDWLASRAAQTTRTVATKEHGTREPESVSGTTAVAAEVLLPAASTSASRADVPSTVPELPSAYLVRDEDLSQLKAALLAGGASNSTSTALTSKVASGKQQKKQNKVGAHGMGGVGKTTLAAALVHDGEVRARFEKIVWVSLGAEPEIRELASSIHFQLTDQHFPESIKRDDEALKALKIAAKGTTVLLVLDDVWESKFEKPLNCIDPDNASRLLVTTRVRSLLKNSVEVDVGILSAGDALKLLLSSAEMEEEDIEEGSECLRVANEIVELCGRLPLTLSIAGGMISDNPDGFSEDVLDLIKEDGLREQDDEEHSGVTIEERIISSSLKMVKGKNRELILSVFKFFSVFPEDVAVPGGVFNLVAPVLIPGEKNPKKAKLAVGSCLSTLLKYNLIKGSLGAGHRGVFMHDLVRDYVINLHSDVELQELHRTTVRTILAARPDSGFPVSSNAAPATLEEYACLNLHVHFRGALAGGEEPLEAWLTHADTAILQNVAMAVGLEMLTAMADAREQAGDLVGAAHALFVLFLSKNVDPQLATDVLKRAAALLEQADDKGAIDFEKKVVELVWGRTLGADINQKYRARLKTLTDSQGLTWESKCAEGQNSASSIFGILGLFGGDADVAQSFQAVMEVTRVYGEVATFPDCPESIRSWCGALQGPMFFGCFGICAAQVPEYETFVSSMSETKATEAINFYSRSVCGVVFIEKWGFDPFQFGYLTVPTALVWGNIDLLETLEGKYLATFKEMDLPVTKNYAQHMFEVYDNTNGAAGTLLIVERYAQAYSLFKAMGFAGWDADSLENITTLITVFKSIFVGVDLEKDMVWFRLAIFLAAPPGLLDESEVNEWMPSPSALAAMEKDYAFFKRYSVHDVTATGARCFLRLGRDDEAYELARLAVSPEQNTEKKSTLAQCHVVLGKVAAKRGDLDEAAGHFQRALEEARLSCMPVLEVMAARDWKAALLEPNGRDCGPAEAAIDAACAKMKKTRGQLRGILE